MKKMGMKMKVFQSDKERAYFPTEGWNRSTPEQQEMDSSILAEVLDISKSILRATSVLLL
jgi:hypothetical protein